MTSADHAKEHGVSKKGAAFRALHDEPGAFVIPNPWDIGTARYLLGANVHLAPDTLRCDPNLGALMDNGGPTLTMAPASLSCAIDAGPSTTSVVDDQRGALRVVGLHADIGAVEEQN